MRSLSLTSRLGPRSTFAGVHSSRIEVRPPSLRHAPSSRWDRLLFWLLAPAPQDAAPPLNRLPRVRDDFLLTLADVELDSSDALRERIAQARSLRELWHLRAEVYNTVGRAHSQSEAETRLARLDHHFPHRAARFTHALLQP